MRVRSKAILLISALFLPMLSGAVRGQQLELPLPEDSLLHLEAALEQLAEGNPRKANRILGKMKPSGKGSLREILISLINGYSDFGRHLPNQIKASSLADPFLKKALWHAKRGRAADTHYQQALTLIRGFLDALGTNRAAPMARSLLCNLRMLSGDKSTDGESTNRINEDVDYPERIFSPVGAFTYEARRARVNGVIVSQVVIDSEGCVVSVRILKGLPHGLNKSMTNAFRWWAFEPAKLDGQPISVYYNLTTTYAIR